jgi:hypothetical protein
MHPLERCRFYDEPVPLIASPETRSDVKEILFGAGMRAAVLEPVDTASHR